MERIEKWLKTFWWARGAVTVITLITLIAPLLNLEMHNFLKILHAFIVGWNIVTNSVGEKLSYLLQISIRPTLINTILLCVSAIWPFCYFLIKRMMLLHKQAVLKIFFV